MTLYVAERSLPGITLDGLAGAQRKAIDQAATMRENGVDVRYLRSLFVPDDGRCLCLFEAASPDVVTRLNDDAGIPYRQVTEVLDLAP